MASFFGEIVTRTPRYLDDEDEDSLQACQDYNYFLTGNTIKGEENKSDLLLISDGKLASTFSKLFLSEGAESDGTVEARHPQTEAGHTVCDIYSADNHTVVTTSPVSPANMFPLAETLLSLVLPTSTVLLLTERHSSELRTDGRSPATHCLATPQLSGPLPCDRLPAPNILSGLPAAVLSLCQMRGMPGLLLVTYTDVLSPDSISLSGFCPMFSVEAVAKAGLHKPVDIAAKLREANLTVQEDSLYM